MISDHYIEKWPTTYPELIPWTTQTTGIFPTPSPSQADFDALKKEVEDLKGLLARARKYDEDNNEPHCELESKIKMLKRIAELVGVDLGFDKAGTPPHREIPGTYE